MQPRATEHIGQMIALNEKLIASGHAYEAEGHVLFDVSSKPDYGTAGAPQPGRDDRRRPGRCCALQERRDGFRPVEAVGRRDARLGFARGAAAAPAGTSNARPWRAEYLGESFDIHGGGIDLMFPHHENEIAQSECGHGGKPHGECLDA